jgi:LuxR family maltose regulon positive regulatory protein
LDQLADLSPVTVLSGSPGAGKTVLMAEWARRSDRPVAWITLDRSGTSYERFWSLVIAALSEACEGEAWPRHRVLRQWSAASAVSATIELFARLERPVLVIDDVDQLHDRAAALIAELIAILPGGSSLVLISRTASFLPLHRLRLSGGLLEVSATDLRFDMGEGAELLEHVAGRSFDQIDVGMLLERTEGWAAGLHLAALTLRDEHQPTHFLHYFTGSSRLVSEYLLREVLEREPAATVRFLLETSVLDVLTERLCAAVTGRDDAGRVLRELSDRSLFLVSVGGAEGSYRYHQLFAELLRHVLRSESPEHFRHVHMRAAEECHAMGDIEGAVRHFAEAGADSRALSLMAKSVVEQWRSGLVPSGALPREYVSETSAPETPLRSYLWAALSQAALRTKAASHLVRTLSESVVYDPRLVALSPRVHLLRLVDALFAVHPEDVLREAEQIASSIEATGSLPAWPADIAESHPWLDDLDTVLLSMLPDFVARAHTTMGDHTAARQVLRDGLAGVTLEHDLTRSAVAAEVSLAEGRLSDAYASANKVLELTSELGLDETVTVMGARRILGTVCRERDELGAAEDELLQALRIAEHVAHPLWQVLVELELALLRVAQGNHDEALELYQRIRWTDAWAPFPSQVRSAAICGEIRFWLAVGDLDTATSLSLTLEPDCPPLLRARLELRAGRPGECREALRTIGAPLSVGDQLERLLLLAGADLLVGRHREARQAVHRALDLARPEWYVRRFLDEGEIITTLIARVAEYREPYANHLLSRIPDSGPRSVPQIPDVILEPLTVKEREVLACLSSHLSLGQIATEMYVSLNTVKTHVRNVYRKLGASSRAQAVATARACGLM